jgi:hypothetical protein
MGAVLSQYFAGNLHPVVYYSRTLIPAELNYPIHDKELLASICALCEWKVYLKETVKPVTIYTDHKSLEYFMTTKELNRQQARWALELAEYHFIIKYRKESSNDRANALSRRPGDKPLKGGETHKTVLK